MREKLNDISSLTDIRLLVDTFYTRVREDQLIGSIFEEAIKDEWPRHLEKMYRFWQTVLLDEHTYHGSPFLPHAQMSIAAEHFDAWIGLWTDTVDSLFSGERADRAKWQGQRMADMFLHKINYYKVNNSKPLL